MGHSDEVQDGIGGAAERDDERDGILKGLLRHDIARSDAQLDHVHDGCAGVEAVDELIATHSGLGAGIGETHAHGLNRAGHGVGGIHATAGAFSWD